MATASCVTTWIACGKLRMDKPDAPHKDHLLTRRSSYTHWMKEQVRWSDTDMVGHVNNVAFAVFCETVRTHLMRPVFSGDSNPRAMVLLARITINFLGELHWPAIVEIGTGVLAVGRSSLHIGQGLFDGERCVGSAESVMVMIDEATRKSAELPAWVRTYLSNFSIVEAS